MSTVIQIPAGGGTISLPLVATTVAAASGGVSLPASSIAVASTTGFPGSGAILLQTATGPAAVIYTGTNATHFTGCRGGLGVLATGDQVVHVIIDGPHSIPDVSTNWELVINRNVGATPIDTLPANPCLWMLFQTSLDGGATWQDNAGGEVVGGAIIPTRGPNAGVEQTTSGVGFDLPPGSSRQVRAGFAALAAFTVNGTLTLTP